MRRLIKPIRWAKVKDMSVTTAAGSFTVGNVYVIATTGTTNFMAIGAQGNQPGTPFTATGVGSGTGTAYPSVLQSVDTYKVKKL